jgi:DNA-binding GntR family transcriptional regulator
MGGMAPEKSQTESVVERLRTGIATGHLKPDLQYSVQSLADEFGVGRTPVREALLQLVEAGIVRFERNKGIRVIDPDLHDLEEIFQLRLMLEPSAAYHAARRVATERVDKELLERLQEVLVAMEATAVATDEGRFTRFTEHDVAFHELVLKAAGNERVVHVVRNLRDVTSQLGAATLLRDALRIRDPLRNQGPYTVDGPRTLIEVVEEHRPVLQALQKPDAETARARMHEHVLHSGQMLLEERQRDVEHQGAFDPGWSHGIGCYHDNINVSVRPAEDGPDDNVLDTRRTLVEK